MNKYLKIIITCKNDFLRCDDRKHVDEAVTSQKLR